MKGLFFSRAFGRFQWLILLWVTISVQAADQCSAVLANPVQSHASPGSLTMSGQSSITGSSSTTFPFLTKNIQAQASCNNGGQWVWNGSATVWVSNCNITGSLASAISGLAFITDPADFPSDPADFPNFSSTNTSSCNSSKNVTAGSYGNISWSSSNCVAQLATNGTYYFQSLSITGGAKVNINGATVYVKTLTVNGDSARVYGSGRVFANAVSVSGNGKFETANVTAYQSISLSVNSTDNVTAIFQPHYLSTMTLSLQSIANLAAGNWSVKQLTMNDNSKLTFQGKVNLNLYDLSMATSTAISTNSVTRSDLTVKMYQSLVLRDNAYIDGYIEAHYLDTFAHYSSANISFYFTGGNHWINNLTMSGTNDQFIFDSGSAANLYVNSDLTISGQMKINPGGAANNLMLLAFGAVTLTDNANLNSVVYVNNDDFILSNQTVLTGAVSAVNVVMKDNSKIIYQAYGGSWPGVCDTNYTCFTDDFNRSSVGSDWVINASSSSTKPSLVSNRLRMTTNTTNQATSATYQRLFPADGNLVTVEFDHVAYGSSGTGADGVAVVLSDATVTPQPGSYGGPLGYGYKPNINGFAGGWLGMGLDEYGNYSTEYATTGPGFTSQAVAIRGSGSGTSGYVYLKGTSTLSPGVSRGSSLPSSLYRYRLTVDSRTSGTAMVKVERNTGSGFQTLISSFNAMAYSTQAALPDDFFLSLTGSTGSATNNHDFDNIEICALKSNAVGQQIDHFEFDFSGSPLTCSPQTMTIRACANAACTSLITESVTATLAPSSLADGGWVGGNVVTFTGGSSTLSLAKRTAGAVSVGVTGSVPSTQAYSSTLCRVGSTGALSSSACTLTFADSGFIFDVPDIIANKAASNVLIKAVKKDDSTKQCVPGFASTSKTLNFWSDYIDPVATGRPVSRQVSVNSTAIGLSSTEATPLTLAFDAQGQATLSNVNYTDAGKMQLNARYTGSAGTGDEGLLMSGSDQFVSRPAGLCIQPQTVCAAGNSSCPYFRRAGETFPLAVAAKAWESDSDTDLCTNNLSTPNFVLNSIPLGSERVAPSSGVNGTVGLNQYSHIASSGGQMSLSQSVSEVGVFRFTATPPLYMGYALPVAKSAPVGRFTPYDFALSNGSITPGCGSFSYMDQPMPTSFTVNARNLSGGTTSNYRDEFATATLGLVAENGDNGVPLSSRLSGLGSLGWQAGLFTANLHPETFTRNAPPDGPFSQLAIGLQLFDNESAIDLPLKDTNMNATTSGACGSNCTAVRLSTQDLRHGRLSVSSGRAAVDSALALSLTLESYTGSGWQRNADDGCTQLDLQASGGFVFDRSYDSNEAQLTLIDNSATSRLALATSRDTPTGQPTSATAQAGYIWLHFTAPGISDRVNYQLDLSKQPKQPTWLSFDWNGDGVTTVSDMGGWAFFNQWRSSDRVIYRREVLN